jgi:hypothetical protein
MSWAIEAYDLPTLAGLSMLIPTAAMRPEFEPYRASLPAVQVFAGDPPSAPVLGVELLFADNAEARTVLGWVED